MLGARPKFPQVPFSWIGDVFPETSEGCQRCLASAWLELHSVLHKINEVSNSRLSQFEPIVSHVELCKLSQCFHGRRTSFLFGDLLNERSHIYGVVWPKTAIVDHFIK